MKQYIDKSALVAEIERRFLEDYNTDDVEMDEVAQGVLASLKYFIDTLEVKEVDLEKEFDNYAKDILACDVQFEPFTHLYNCAKHFFELGLKAQKEGNAKKERYVVGVTGKYTTTTK